MNPLRVRGALLMAKQSVPKIARRHGCSDKTLYAVIEGHRPGHDPKVQAAIADIEQIMRGVLSA